MVREALRRLERPDRWQADQAEGLRRAWAEGIASGDAGPFDFAELRAAARHELTTLTPTKAVS